MSPAAAAASATSDLLTTKRNELLSLSNQKQSLEIEVNAIISELTAPITITNDNTTNTTAPPMGIDTPLVDAEGYPRSDIDIYRARTLRKRFHEIQTDVKVLDGKIERGLLELTALREASAAASSDGGEVSSNLQSMSVNNNKMNEAEEIMARRAPKPKPKFDPITKKWVVKSWDGSVAGVENGEVRKFDDLSHSTGGALASIVVSGGNGGASVSDSATLQQHGSSTQQRPAPSSTSTEEQQRSATPSTQQTIALTPFAIIDQVFPNSPSQEAGIQEGDLLLRFGTVTSNNHNGVFDSIKRAIVTELSLAAANECSISVAVRRTTKMLGGVAEMIRTETFDLRPRTWAGQGLLGCHLQEYKE
eukprot:scaffold7689_cov139-Skeletonema_menzelii.AAC.4